MILCFGIVVGNVPRLLAENTPAVASKLGTSPQPAVAEKRAPKPKLTQAQITKLIDDLGARNYTVRETATKQLLEAGGSAVVPLVEAAEKDNLEVRLRVLRVLESLLTKGSHSEYVAAESGLEKLQQSKNGAISSRAGNILASMGEVREKRAIEALRELNGIVKSDANLMAFMPNNLPPGEQLITTVILKKDWKGKTDGLKHLEKLRFLRTVYVVGGVLPEETMVQLERKLANVKVEPRGRACLGVGGFATEGGCEISIINPGSAAAKAGLREGNLIVAFNGKRGEKEGDPLDFDRLVQLIKEVDAGDKVPVVFRRTRDDKTERTVVVTMDEWK
ncbi:MAG: PDZ domain-containing protein [Planctomycetaceae bacterium]|nr:PDZ domain-containing protein [Planctomycetaceae bacterium]